MTGFLFEDIIFGPVKSRRLGVSLGVNLLPTQYKYCSFNCIYCECGWNQREGAQDVSLPTPEAVVEALEMRLTELKMTGPAPDAITFAGNGEPTIHPEFNHIIKETIRLRDTFSPSSSVSVLSNASMLHKPEVLEALQMVDLNILKLDAGTEETFRQINQPPRRLTLDLLLEQLKSLGGNLIIQSIFVKGTYDGKQVDNTRPEELQAWIGCLKEIKPEYVMIYTIDRATPAKGLEKVSFDDLLEIGRLAEEAGIPAKVYG